MFCVLSKKREVVSCLQMQVGLTSSSERNRKMLRTDSLSRVLCSSVFGWIS